LCVGPAALGLTARAALWWVGNVRMKGKKARQRLSIKRRQLLQL
jgi:hypothetical protein